MPSELFLLEEIRARATAEEGAGHGLQLPGEPRIEAVTVDHQRRPVVVLPAGRWSWSGVLPEGARLQAGVTSVEGKALEASVILWQGNEGAVIAAGVAGASAADRDGEPPAMAWIDLEADLGAHAGQPVRLDFVARTDAAEVGWGPVTVASSGIAQARAKAEKDEAPPNVLLIVVDTLRYDRLSSYGYHRATSPEIDALLAERGVLLEDAYAQAPWTLPSIVSLLTGRYPTELLADEAAAFRIPETVPVLAEHLRDLGYSTAAFYANPALHAGTGFDRGFDTFFAPPADFGWFRRHADDLNRRMLPWVKALGDGPFFLYAHYLDPHDPYDNPDLVDGKSPFFPDYAGTISGNEVHRIYGGFKELPDPENDVAHLSALYDSEVAYVDRHVGELLRTVGEDRLANTLVVLTSDHGEELYEHGGWKHGQSLYEEQIHVPLIFRWDGRLPAGKRLKGTVELLDVVPTVLAAAGGEVDPLWQGHDLLPALRGEASLPRRAAFSQHLSAGPLRAAVVLDGHKLLLFNRQEPFDPPDAFQAYLWRKDLRRFEDAELYDLERDPLEQASLLPGEEGARADARQMAPLIHRRLDLRLPGARLVPHGVPQGQRLEARLRFDRTPEGWDPYFLAEDDQVKLDGKTLEVSWAGGEWPVPGRGILLRGEFETVQVEEIRLDGKPLPPSAVSVGTGRPGRGEEIDRRELRVSVRPVTPERPGLALWEPEVDLEARAAEEDPETIRRLKALGYLLQ